MKDLKLRQRWPALALAIVTLFLALMMFLFNIQGIRLAAALVPLLFAALFLVLRDKKGLGEE